MDSKRRFGPYEKFGLHLLAALGVSLLLALWMYLDPTGRNAAAVDQASLGLLFLQTSMGMVFFLLPPIYLSIYGLVPATLMRRRYLLFALGLIALSIGWGCWIGFAEGWTDEHWFGEPSPERQASDGIAVVAFILLISIPLHLSYRWFIQLSRIKQMQNDQLQKELSLLRNQINPHFFFNTLNNLYALSLEQSGDTPQVILKLSEMMRYAIYECKEAEVPVENEVRYLENYIALQAIRQHQGTVEFTHEISAAEVKVAPMILIVFVENAFKHGMERMSEGGWIRMDLKVGEKALFFRVENNFDLVESASDGGMGLENVKRRLSLIYGDRYELSTDREEEVFRIQLRLEL